MGIIYNVATLLGGVAAVWLLYDKRLTIANWFKISFADSVNPLSLPDEEFLFINQRSGQLLRGPYLPEDSEEEYLCKSLVNLGLLKRANRNKFKLTSSGKKFLLAKNT